MKTQWLIYGANGYTGKLIAEEAKRRGLNPVLGGRNQPALSVLGKNLNLPVTVFPLNDPEKISENLKGIDLVLHCAGPFSATHPPMFEACLRAKSHYLDITGEIEVFERANRKQKEAKERGIVAIPGVGFDVVPTDCLAAMLKKDLPDAHELRLGFSMGAKPSKGTLKTMVEGLGVGGMVRKNGKLVNVGFAYRTRQIQFEGRERWAVTIPWGDVSTAFYSTQIPNIEVYMAAPAKQIWGMRALRVFRPLLANRKIQTGLKKMIDSRWTMMSEEALNETETLLWGEVENRAGKKVVKRLKTPQGYRLTIDAAIASTERVLNGEVKAGVWTPSSAFGADFVLGLSGVSLISDSANY